MTVTLSNPDSLERLFYLGMDAMARFESCPVIAVAVSGGSDSMALIYLAQLWATSRGGKIVALTVDHGLRAESAEEAGIVGKMLAADGIEHHILRWEAKKPTSNIQSEARTARYDLMAEWCAVHNILHLLTAHHRDDQAETLLIRLERGSGLDGLSGMPAIAPYKKIRILRPLLTFSKQALQDYLTNHDKVWVEDPSNQKATYTRNRIRQCLTLEEELLAKRLAATADHLGRARASVDISTAKAISGAIEIFPEGYAVLRSCFFKDLPEEEALHMLAAVLTTIGGNYYKPRFQSLALLYKNIIRQAVTGCTLWGCAIVPQKESLILICREVSAILPMSIAEGQGKWDNRFTFRLNALTYFPSLAIECLHMGDWKKLTEEKPSLKRILLPKQVIITLPTLKSLDSVLAIPHIGYYREGITLKEFSCRFQPRAALTGMPFHYKNI